jgi:two-component system response regulator FixJ
LERTGRRQVPDLLRRFAHRQPGQAFSEVTVGEIQKQHIFIVDDEPDVGDAMRRTLELAGYEVSMFGSAAGCLAALRSEPCDLLVTDAVMPGMNGIELLAEIKCRVPSLPILVVTGYGNVQMAVAAMDAGASNFIEKPLERTAFLTAVEIAFERDSCGCHHLREPLTKAETEVLRLIVDGKSNKEIARLRHRSVRTIEDQRRCIMRKFGVDNPVDLFREVAIVRIPGRLQREQLHLPFERG